MKKVFVAGHRGMVGSAVARQLAERSDVELVLRTRQELDLLDAAAVRRFFETERPDEVVVAAARVGGIGANSTLPADFIYENLAISTSVIHSAFETGVARLLYLGSSCIYPKFASQPITESELLTGSLEPTNEPYALAKIAGLKMCEAYNRQHGTDFRAVMPTNLYGPNDNFDEGRSHVLPALLRRFHEAAQQDAKEVVVWGSGRPRREFLYVDDLAEACVHVLELSKERYDAHVEPTSCFMNVGTGLDCTIAELAELIARTVGFTGRITFDDSMPDGTPRKLLDVSRIRASGWTHRTDLEEGVRRAYEWYVANL